jgi:hypothetical protein
MDWTSYASSLIIAVFFAVATASSASAYFYSQTPESRQTSECGEAGCFYDFL